MVTDCLEKLSAKLPHPLINLGEHSFDREEADLPLSIDFYITHDIDIENCDFLQVVFLIECKYCTKGTGWYFIRQPEKDAGQELFVENFFSKGKVNRKNFPILVPPLNNDKIPVCGKGIEVYGNGQRNEKTIKEGFHQLLFASCDSIGRAFIKEEFASETYLKHRKINIKNRSFHSLICPILVTTAELHFMDNLTIEKVENSEKNSDFSNSEPLLVYSMPSPPNYASRYIRENIFRTQEQFLTNQEKTNAKVYLMEYALLNPSRFYVVNFKQIEKFIEDYISLASSMLSYACKKE
jgi:hypothetical protein